MVMMSPCDTPRQQSGAAGGNRAEFGRACRDFRPPRQLLPDLNRPLMSPPLGGERSCMVGNDGIHEVAPQAPAPGSISCIICAYNEADRIGRVLRAVVG